MESAVLRPQDCLGKPLKATTISRPDSSRHPNRRKRSSNNSSPPKKPNQPSFGQVKILKRGETLDTASFKRNEPDQTDLVKKFQNLVEKPNRRTGFYTGSTFVTSPPPSSLPLPGFIKILNESWGG